MAGRRQSTGPGGQPGWDWIPAGGSTGSQQAGALTSPREAIANPPAIGADTAVAPMQQEAYQAAKDYSSGLAKGTDEMTTRELSRARDDISVGMRAEGEGAMSRGADPTLFRTQALDRGARYMQGLQGRLADVSLGRKAQAVGLQTEAAGAATSEQRMMHLGMLSHRLGEERSLREQAEVQSRLDEAPYDRLSRMMDSVGRSRDDYAAFAPGSGGVLGGGSDWYGGGGGGVGAFG